MNKVANKLGRPITGKDYNEYGKYSHGVLIQKNFTFAEFRDEIGLDKPKGKISEEALDAWKEELKDFKGRYTFEELKGELKDTGFPLTKKGVADLREYLEDTKFQFNRSVAGSKAKYYIEGPEAQTIEEYYEQFLDRIPNEKEEWFRELAGTGTRPSSIVAAIRYLTENKTQNEIADEEDITEVSLRKAKRKIIERFDLDENAGREENLV
jgi:hypothetical protein